MSEPVSAGMSISQEQARQILKKYAAKNGFGLYEPVLWMIEAMQEAATVGMDLVGFASSDTLSLLPMMGGEGGVLITEEADSEFGQDVALYRPKH